jgi:hypothetical protein
MFFRHVGDSLGLRPEYDLCNSQGDSVVTLASLTAANSNEITAKFDTIVAPVFPGGVRTPPKDTQSQ